jgi:hypothetical protein
MWDWALSKPGLFSFDGPDGTLQGLFGQEGFPQWQKKY